MWLPWIFTSIVQGVYLVMSAAFLRECAYARTWFSSLVSVVTGVSRYAAVRLSVSLGASRSEESPKALALPRALPLFISHPASTLPTVPLPLPSLPMTLWIKKKLMQMMHSLSHCLWILRWQQHWGKSWCNAFSKAEGCLYGVCLSARVWLHRFTVRKRQSK